MECKFEFCKSKLGTPYLIKVEPYWNVNIYEIVKDTVYKYIKVEPYWNVNYVVLK